MVVLVINDFMENFSDEDIIIIGVDVVENVTGSLNNVVIIKRDNEPKLKHAILVVFNFSINDLVKVYLDKHIDAV